MSDRSDPKRIRQNWRVHCIVECPCHASASNPKSAHLERQAESLRVREQVAFSPHTKNLEWVMGVPITPSLQAFAPYAGAYRFIIPSRISNVDVSVQ